MARRLWSGPFPAPCCNRELRVATWNVNGLRARLAYVLHWLRSRQPDIVGLQELKLLDEQFPTAAFEEEGYSALTHGQKAWNGVAILSREPADVRQIGLPGQEALGSRLLTADVRGLRFTTVYVPNGKHLDHPDFQRKLGWLDALAEYVRSTHDSGRAAVLCGDFNVVPHGIDSWNEERLEGTIFHTESERARIAYLLEGGLVDLYREKYPDERMFSWWDYRYGSFYKNRGLRIDFLLGTPAVADRLADARIDRDYRKKISGLTASDHAPVIADLN